MRWITGEKRTVNITYVNVIANIHRYCRAICKLSRVQISRCEHNIVSFIPVTIFKCSIYFPFSFPFSFLLFNQSIFIFLFSFINSFINSLINSEPISMMAKLNRKFRSNKRFTKEGDISDDFCNEKILKEKSQNGIIQS